MATLAPDDPRHGTTNGYKNLGCRCDACKRAYADWMRAYRHRRGIHRPRAVYFAERYPGPPPHGTESRYTSRISPCRCEACRTAATAATRKRRQARA